MIIRPYGDTFDYKNAVDMIRHYHKGIQNDKRMRQIFMRVGYRGAGRVSMIGFVGKQEAFAPALIRIGEYLPRATRIDWKGRCVLWWDGRTAGEPATVSYGRGNRG